MSGAEDEIVTDGAKAITSAFQDPSLLAAFESRMNALSGHKSSYIDSLPQEVKIRIKQLTDLQLESKKIELEFHCRVVEIEREFLGRYDVVYQRRAGIVAGLSEGDTSKSEEKEVNGIPEFWLTCLKNLPPVSEMITEADEGALKSLLDIKYTLLATPGFKLDFVFAPNTYFSNTVLSKSYHLTYSDETYEEVYSHAEGCDIDWKDGMDLGSVVTTRKQKHKQSNKTRVVKKVEPCPTFFNFFSPPAVPDDDDDDDVDVEAFESDYDIGEVIKDRVIPNAIDWFTGDALEEFDDDEGFDDDDDDDDIDEDDDDDDDDEFGDEGGDQAQGQIKAGKSGGVEKAPECKQQ